MRWLEYQDIVIGFKVLDAVKHFNHLPPFIETHLVVLVFWVNMTTNSSINHVLRFLLLVHAYDHLHICTMNTLERPSARIRNWNCHCAAVASTWIRTVLKHFQEGHWEGCVRMIMMVYGSPMPVVHACAIEELTQFKMCLIKSHNQIVYARRLCTWCIGLLVDAPWLVIMSRIWWCISGWVWGCTLGWIICPLPNLSLNEVIKEMSMHYRPSLVLIAREVVE